MAGFVQIIQYTTSRIEEVEALGREQAAQRGPDAGIRVVATADRDHPNQYLVIAEFDSYEAAMENSNRPETAEFAAAMAKLCDGPPTFYNLDVMYAWPQ